MSEHLISQTSFLSTFITAERSTLKDAAHRLNMLYVLCQIFKNTNKLFFVVRVIQSNIYASTGVLKERKLKNTPLVAQISR